MTTPVRSAESFFVSVLVALATFAGLEAYYRGSFLDDRVKKNNIITAKALDYEQQGGDIVVTGDSRMFHGVMPRVMTETIQEKTGLATTTYNFGIPSGTTPTFLIVALKAARHHPPPRVFVIGLNPPSFSCCDKVSTVGTPPAVSASAMPFLVGSTWRDDTEEAGASVAYGFSRLLATRTELEHAVFEVTLPPPATFGDRGWTSLGGRVDPQVQNVRAVGRAPGYADLMDKAKGAKPSPLAARYFAATLAVLKDAGIKPVVIGAPQARQLDWFHDEAHTYAEYLATVQRITGEAGVPFVDLNAPPGIESTDFVDGDHLSEPGATLFTRHLAAEVVAPLLR
ncbi:MAG: hypothetical protein JWP97_2744 [Labilithrix sp.]|nr:hypothetical protein [Labilithrix sp.]